MILINPHNYETFFLLYADGELSATEKLAVEQFVQANPDLAVELDLLLQLRLPVDDALVFTGKNSLLRSETRGISLLNCEEYFLLYLDNELTATQKQEVETFVLQHPQQQEAFTLLKEARLTEEKIIFPDKISLYREKKERPVFYLRWQRIAVAAAIIAAVVLVWTLVPNNNNPATYTAGQNNQALQTPATKTIQDAAVTTGQGNDLVVIQDPRNSTVSLFGKKDKTAQQAENPGRNIRTPDTKELALPATVGSNELITKADPVVITPRSTNGNTAGTTREVSGNNAVLDVMDRERSLATQTILASNPSQETEAQPAVYRELDTESADQRKSLLLGSIEINKDKLRGFFRKAGSIFRSKAKADEEAAPVTNTRSLE